MIRIRLFILMISFSYSQAVYHGNSYISDIHEISTLKINLKNASIHIIGWEKNDIKITARDKRKISDVVSSGFLLLTSVNDIHLHQEDPEEHLSYKIYVPVDMNLKITIHEEGYLRVRHLKGEIEANTSIADIRLNELSGSAILNSQSGSIHVDFIDVNDDQQLAFSNSYGRISLSLPTNSKASFRFSTISGDIYSDHRLIQIKDNKRSKIFENDFLPKTPGMSHFNLNDGGTIIPIHTLTGDIYIEKLNQKGNENELN